MPRPNFFCGIEALQWLLQNEPKSEQDNIDLTVDLIEAPYLFFYSSDAEAWYFKAGRGKAPSGREKAESRAGTQSTGGKTEKGKGRGAVQCIPCRRLQK